MVVFLIQETFGAKYSSIFRFDVPVKTNNYSQQSDNHIVKNIDEML